MMNKQLGVAVRRQGKTRDAFGFALIFGLHLLHQGKRWKTYNKRKVTISLTAMLRQAQHDKE
jgi:hypothetical protein